MNATDWATILNSGNDIALQWYAISHQTQVPALPSYQPTPGGGRINLPSGSTVLIGIALVLVAVVVLNK